jgi:hypothetical protein
MLRTAFKLALRQTEGLMTSALALIGLTLSAPDHSTVCRRAVTLPLIQPAQVPHGPLHVLIDSNGLQVYGAGQWLEGDACANGNVLCRAEATVRCMCHHDPLIAMRHCPKSNVSVGRS